MNTQYQQPQSYQPQYAQPNSSEPCYCQECMHAANSEKFEAPPASQPYETPVPQGNSQPGANASYYNGAPMNGPGAEGAEDEKGLGSTVVGGAAGGYAGHKMGGGKLGAAAGAALGAIGLNMATHAMKPKPSVAAPAMAQPMMGQYGSPSIIDTSRLSCCERRRMRRAMRHGRLMM